MQSQFHMNMNMNFAAVDFDGYIGKLNQHRLRFDWRFNCFKFKFVKYKYYANGFLVYFMSESRQSDEIFYELR